MLSTLLKLVVLYYVIKFIIDRLLPKLKGSSFKSETKGKSDKIKRFESDDRKVKDAEFDEL